MKIATRRKKEKQLMELMKRATDQCSDGIVITNAKLDNDNAKILYTNNAFCNMTGYCYNELVGKSLLILHGPRTDPQILARRRIQLSEGHSFNGKLVKYRKDGSEFYSECDSAPVFSRNGEITHYIYIMRDVSKQVSTEKNKEKLVNVVSNEIKTPLTSIKGFIHILRKRINEQRFDKSGEYLTLIDSETERIIKLTNKLLKMTRFKTVGVVPNKKPCDLDITVRQVIKNIKFSSNAHKIKRRGKIGIVVSCDEERIREVLANLLTNAIKYSPSAKEVFVYVKKNNSHVLISVQDFGIGIPMNRQEVIFSRLTPTTNGHQSVSSGVGLYIASEIVKSHGGKIWVESTEGRGSIFTFSIPIASLS